MKRQILACFYLCVSSVLFSSDATIEDVVTFERGDKTSVVITYSGTENLRFFAVDSTDDIFSLDLPGVFSRFDFATLAFSQVVSVKQVPLDPDVSNGISVRFLLAEGVTYDVFESGTKTLTLFFEGAPDEEDVVVALAEPVAEPSPATTPLSAPASNVQKSLSGSPGDGRLYEVAVDAAGTGGKLFVSVEGMEKFNHFFLDSPKRFVLDLHNTVLGLSGNDLQLDHPLVDKVRIRQFQSFPKPITRLVLDLAGNAHVSVQQGNDGLIVFFADDTEHLAALLDAASSTAVAAVPDSGAVVAMQDSAAVVGRQDESQLEQTSKELSSQEEPVEALASVEEPVATQLPVEDMPAEPIVALPLDEVVANEAVLLSDALGNDSVSEVSDIPVVDVKSEELSEMPADGALDADLGKTLEVAEDSLSLDSAPEMVSEKAADTSVVINEMATEPVALSNPDEEMAEFTHSSDVAVVEEDFPETAVENEPVLDEDSEPTSAQDTIAILEAAPDELPAQETVALTEPPLFEEAAEDTEPATSLSMANGQALAQGSEVAEVVEAISEEPPTSTLADSVTADEPVMASVAVGEPIELSSSAEPVANVVEMVEEEPAPLVAMDTVDVANDGADLPLDGLEDVTLQEETPEEQPSFLMASDIDLEMAAFLKEESGEKPLHQQMKGLRSTRREHDGVRVTNGRIAKHKVLGEAGNLQDEGEESEDFAELFQEEESSIKSLGEEDDKYRGFEIMIDIREQPVLDLLRFLADEVGFNLYVDSSVRNVTATYKFRNIPWDQALDIILTNANLAKEFRNGVLRVATTDKFGREEKARIELRRQRELGVPTETVTVDLNYARARDIVPIVSEYLSPRGSIIRDDRTNILIIRDIPKFMVDIRTLISRLDKRIPQVSIEARIVETSTRFLRELGIQWGLTAQYAPETGTETGVDFPHRVSLGGPRIGQAASPLTGPEGGYAVNLPAVSENPVGVGLTLGNFLDNFKLDISMQLLESEGQGQIISSPKVTTQNNRTAVITNGQRIPIQTIQRGTVTTRFIDAVLELQVTPQITADETIIMDLLVDKSEPDFTRASGAGGNPIINVSRAETQVLVKNGGTAVIGGIFTLNEQVSETGVPTLRKIPVLRRLFSNQSKQYSNQELLIFVTPKIVKY